MIIHLCNKSSSSGISCLNVAISPPEKLLLVSLCGLLKALERRSKEDYVTDDPNNPKLYHAKLLERCYCTTEVSLVLTRTSLVLL